jgi:hypothetical protein
MEGFAYYTIEKELESALSVPFFSMLVRKLRVAHEIERDFASRFIEFLFEFFSEGDLLKGSERLGKSKLEKRN